MMNKNLFFIKFNIELINIGFIKYKKYNNKIICLDLYIF